MANQRSQDRYLGVFGFSWGVTYSEYLSWHVANTMSSLTAIFLMILLHSSYINYNYLSKNKSRIILFHSLTFLRRKKVIYIIFLDFSPTYRGHYSEKVLKHPEP